MWVLLLKVRTSKSSFDTGRQLVSSYTSVVHLDGKLREKIFTRESCDDRGPSKCSFSLLGKKTSYTESVDFTF